MTACRYQFSETAPIVAWLKGEAEVLEIAARAGDAALDRKSFILMAATLRGAASAIAEGLPGDAPGFSLFSRLAAESAMKKAEAAGG